MKRLLLSNKQGIAIILVIIVTMFFIPWGETVSAAMKGPDSVGWVSPSYAIFQCGPTFGGYPIIHPDCSYSMNVETSNPFWASFWNCDYPHF